MKLVLCFLYENWVIILYHDTEEEKEAEKKKAGKKWNLFF